MAVVVALDTADRRLEIAAMSSSSSSLLACTWADRVAHWNRTFPHYPPIVYSHGWVYGVWYCPTSFQRNVLYGQYPLTFLKRVLALYPELPDARMLHCPSGALNGKTPGVRVDLVHDHVRTPQLRADAKALPFADGSFDVWLSDPPYSDDDGARYGTGTYPQRGAMAEARRILPIGGHYLLLHTSVPTYRKRLGWRNVGLIGVVTGFCKRMRVLSIFERTVPDAEVAAPPPADLIEWG